MTETEYPAEIVPKEGWKANIKGSELLSISFDIVLGRRVDGTLSSCIDTSIGEDAPCLTLEALPLARIINLSTNLMGGPFILPHFAFIPQNKGEEPWDGKDVCLDSIKEGEDFTHIQRDFFVIGWPISFVEGVSFPYKKHFSKDKDYASFKKDLRSQLETEKDQIYLEEYEKLPKDNQGAFVQLSGETRVNHRPTTLNYWHYTVDLYGMDNKDVPLQEAKNAWQKDFRLNVSDRLRRSFYIIPDQLTPYSIQNWEKLVEVCNE